MDESPASPDALNTGPNIQIGNEKFVELRTIYENFIKLTTRCVDLAVVYRNRPIWAEFTADIIVKDARQCYKRIPTSRMAVHTFIGLLIHESAHLYFSQLESNQNSMPIYLKEEDACVILLDMVDQHLRSRFSKGSTLEVLSWTCNLACELHLNNSQRPCARNTQAHVNAEQFLALMSKSRSVERLLRLINSTIDILLRKCTDDCLNLLFDASRAGGDFNWMWLQISDKFPSIIVSRLFSMGKENFKEYLKIHEDNHNQPMPVTLFTKVVDEWKPRLASFSYLAAFLTTKRNAQLRDAFKNMLEEGFACPFPLNSPVSSSHNSISLLFLCRLVLDSPSLLNTILEQNGRLVSPSHLMHLGHIIQSLPPSCLSSNWIAELDALISGLNTDSIGLVMDTLLRTAFDRNAFTGFEATADPLIPVLREGVLRLLSSSVDAIVRYSHQNPSTDSSVAIMKFGTGRELQELVDWSLSCPHGRASLLQYLHAISISNGVQKGAEIVARFLIRARDEQELGVLLSYLQSFHPYYPSVMAVVYTGMPSFRTQYEDERRITDPSYESELGWVNGIRILMQWDMKADLIDPIKFYGFIPGENLGCLMSEVLSCCIDRIRRCLERKDKTGLAEVIRIVSRFIDATGYSKVEAANQAGRGIAVHVAALPLKYLYKVSLQMATCLRMGLLLMGGGVPDIDSRALLEHLRLSIFSFCHEKLVPVQSLTSYQLFIISFTQGILQEASTLFNDWTQLNPFKLPSIDAPPDTETSACLMDEIRSLSLKQSVASLAHSGRIGTLRGGKADPAPSEDQALQLTAALDILHCACVPRSDEIGREAGLEAAKQIALTCLEAACGDALGADMAFEEWECEKEAIARYVEVWKKVEKSLVMQSILSLLSERHPSLWYTLPILKAGLATLITSYENAVDRNKRPQQSLVDKTDKWMALVNRGQVLPQRLSIGMDILPFVSCHEGSYLLLQIWKYFKDAKISMDSVEEMHKGAVREDPQEALPQADDYMEPFRYVLARNMGELGHFFPILFSRDIDDAIRTS